MGYPLRIGLDASHALAVSTGGRFDCSILSIFHLLSAFVVLGLFS